MATAQFEPRPAAPEIHCSDAQINEVFSGRRFGETRLMQASGLEMCLKNPGAELFCLAQALRHAIDDPLWPYPLIPRSRGKISSSEESLEMVGTGTATLAFAFLIENGGIAKDGIGTRTEKLLVPTGTLLIEPILGRFGKTSSSEAS